MPVLSDFTDVLFQLLLTLLSLLDILRRDGRVEVLCVFLGLQDQVSFEIHEPMEAFIFLDFKNKDIGFLLGRTELD